MPILTRNSEPIMLQYVPKIPVIFWSKTVLKYKEHMDTVSVLLLYIGCIVSSSDWLRWSLRYWKMFILITREYELITEAHA